MKKSPFSMVALIVSTTNFFNMFYDLLNRGNRVNHAWFPIDYSWCYIWVFWNCAGVRIVVKVMKTIIVTTRWTYGSISFVCFDTFFTRVYSFVFGYCYINIIVKIVIKFITYDCYYFFYILSPVISELFYRFFSNKSTFSLISLNGFLFNQFLGIKFWSFW